MQERILNNTNGAEAKRNTGDIQFFGDPDSWELICKASSASQGFMKSTKAMCIENKGCLVQVSTMQKNPDGSYAIAEALEFVSGVAIGHDPETGSKRISKHD